jgi:hypothetical protein
MFLRGDGVVEDGVRHQPKPRECKWQVVFPLSFIHRSETRIRSSRVLAAFIFDP